MVFEARRGLRRSTESAGSGAAARVLSGGQGVARRPGAADHLVEPAVAEEDLAHGQQGPLLADEVGRLVGRLSAREVETSLEDLCISLCGSCLHYQSI